MDLKRIGRYISEKRKAAGFTQKDEANRGEYTYYISAEFFKE